MTGMIYCALVLSRNPRSTPPGSMLTLYDSYHSSFDAGGEALSACNLRSWSKVFMNITKLNYQCCLLTSLGQLGCPLQAWPFSLTSLLIVVLFDCLCACLLV